MRYKSKKQEQRYKGEKIVHIRPKDKRPVDGTPNFRWSYNQRKVG